MPATYCDSLDSFYVVVIHHQQLYSLYTRSLENVLRKRFNVFTIWHHSKVVLKKSETKEMLEFWVRASK
jgi:hypothetical protein